MTGHRNSIRCLNWHSFLDSAAARLDRAIRRMKLYPSAIRGWVARFRLGLILVASIVPPPGVSRASAPGDWRWILPSEVVGLNPDDFDVALGNGIFVGVGGSGVIYTSPDGLNWTRVLSGTLDVLRSVGFGGGTFVAGGGGGIHTSVDGVRWQHHEGPGSTIGLHRIRHVDGLFMAMGYEDEPGGPAGVICTSSDGVEWTRRLRVPPPSTPAGTWPYTNFKGVARGNGRFVAVGARGWSDGTYSEEVFTYTSTDGIEWTPGTTNLPRSNAIFTHDIIFHGAVFVLMHSNRIWTSSDGVSWELRHALDPSWFWRGITNSNERLMCLAQYASPDVDIGRSVISGDGISWDESPMVTGFGRLFSNGAQFFVIGRRTALTSTDGFAWSEHFVPDPLDVDTPGLRDVAFGDQGFVAVGARGAIIASCDGTSWKKQNSGTHAKLTDVIHGGGRYVAAGTGGALIHSTDAQDWTAADLAGVNLSLGPLAHGNGRFVVLSRESAEGFFWTSDDGLDWRLRFSAALGSEGSAFSPFRSIVFGNGRFVATGTDGAVAQSENGIVWERATFPEPYTVASMLHRMAFIGGRFLAPVFASDGNAGLLASSDGLTWTEVDQTAYSSIGFGDGYIVALRGSFTTVWGDVLAPIQSSADGVTWETSAPYFASHGGIASNFVYGAGHFVGVGADFTPDLNGTARLIISGAVPPVPLPELEIHSEPPHLTLQIRGVAGSRWNLQHSQTLTGWQTLRPVTLGSMGLEIDVSSGQGARGFWRLSTP